MSAADDRELADRVKMKLVQMRAAHESPSAKVLALQELATSIVAAKEDATLSGHASSDAARDDTHLAIMGLAMTVERNPHAPFNILWGKAIEAAARWRGTLD